MAATRYTITAVQKRQINVRIQDLTAQFDSYEEDVYYRQLGKLTNMLKGIEKFDGIHFTTASVIESTQPSDLLTIFFFTHVDDARAMKIALQRSLSLIHMPHAMRLDDATQPDMRRLRVDDVTREFANAFVQANPAIDHYEVMPHLVAMNNANGTRRRGRPLGSKNKVSNSNSSNSNTVTSTAVTAESLAASAITDEDITTINNIVLEGEGEGSEENSTKLYCGLTEEEIINEYPQADHSATIEELLARMQEYKPVTRKLSNNTQYTARATSAALSLDTWEQDLLG